jgi:hypothetical protein
MSEQPSILDEAALRALIILMADRLVAEDPDDPMTERARLDLAHHVTADAGPLHEALLARTVILAPDATRASYAQLLRADADSLDLVARYAAANARVRQLGRQIGRDYEENRAWRLAEAEAENLFTRARQAGHSIAELSAAGRAASEATS